MSVWHLHRVVSKKRDPLSFTLFLDVLVGPGEQGLMDTFWTKAAAVLGRRIEAAVRPTGSPFVREALVTYLSRLCALFAAALARVESDARAKGARPALSDSARESFWRAFQPLQTAYLGQALGRMNEVVTAAFSGSAKGLPTAPDVHQCAARIAEVS